jgi:murein DD-endopeptidase MepM/ murein hydrolase activator NlpD
VVGEVTKSHSLDTPVFSNTLNEWRVHTGIDISAEEGAEVYASAKGTVSRVYNDALLGKTVEITHEGGIVTVYANLSNTDIRVKEGDAVKSGAVIGLVGDTSLSELADEAHLHFGVKINGVSVNPLDYISEDSKKASLGITEV